MNRLLSNSIIAAFAFTCLLSSCVQDIDASEDIYSKLPVFKEMVFEAVSGEDNTKTVRNEDGSLSWLPGDEINIFYGSSAYGRFIANNTEIAARTTFTGHFNTEIDGSEEDYWAVYPYLSTNSFDGTGVTLSVPSTQVSSPGSFGPGMFPAVAKSGSTTLAFYNVCGTIKFSLSRGDIDQVTLTNNGDEAVAGSVRVTFDEDGKPVAEALEGSTSITLMPASGECFEQGEYYYMAVLPGTLSRGFTLSFHTVDGEEGILESNSSITIKRSISSKKDNIDALVADWHEANQEQDLTGTGVYLGILAFNQALYSYPVSLLTSESLSACKAFIDGLQMKNGTILYYAADNGLLNMQQGESPKSLAGASLVTFTDGLDQGSLMMNPDYGTEDKYLAAVSNRIRSGNVFGHPLSAFSIGIRGSDVQNTTKFRENLVKLATSEQNAYEISDMSELEARFNEVAETAAVSVEYSHDITLTIPGLPDGTRVRFTFDGVSNASSSNLYIEGTFNLNSKMLTNVSYEGLTSKAGSTVVGARNNIFVRFHFQKVRRDDGRELLSDNVQQWQSAPGSSTWQKNSEFDSAEDTDIAVRVSRKSNIVYLVLDCSSSLGSEFGTMKSKVKSFIQKLYDDSYIETRVQSVQMRPSETSIEKGHTTKLSAMVYPATATNRAVRWSSGNPGVASVDTNGVVTGVSTGDTYISVETVDGEYWASCHVTVFELPEPSQGQTSFTQSGLYLGVLAFNQGLYYYPACRLTQDNVDAICSFVDNMPVQKGSLLYYTLESVLERLSKDAPAYPVDLYYANVVTFSDFLDQGSIMWSRHPFSSEDEYISFLAGGIQGAGIYVANDHGVKVGFYNIGIRGGDVVDISGYEDKLRRLCNRGSYEITNISSLQSQLNSIANVISVEQTYTYSCNLTVTVPGVGNGTRIRLTFDNVSSAAQSNLYIEGTFNLVTKSLTDVVYQGFSPGSGTTITGTANGIFVTYTFGGLQKSDGTQLSTSFLKEWTCDSSESAWQVNSEFDNSNDASVEVSTSIERESAVIYLVLDYSTSIGSMSSSMKSAAKDFIRRLQQKSHDPYSVTAVSLSKTSWGTLQGKTMKLVATVSPSTAINKSVVWSSSNPAVASVDQDGLVTAHNIGSARIKVTTQDGGYTASCIVTVMETIEEAVDLGLPSGLKWATYNIGACHPEEYGDYFAWGETESKVDYCWETYKFGTSATGPFSKYNTNSSFGTFDNRTDLEAEDDAAHVNWGDNWRMPTDAEWKELINNCTWTWTTENGANGCMVTSKVNGNSIFLPAAGGRDGNNFTNKGSKGFFWSSSLYSSYPSFACVADFYSGNVIGSHSLRCYGFPVRPVSNTVSSVSLDKTSLTLLIGDSSTLVATILPATALDRGVTWTSSNESVATVDQCGKVTAVGHGHASITATTDDGGKTASCEVTVNQLVESISLNETEMTLYVGDDPTALIATLSPNEQINPILTWTSSKTSVATVDSEGNVTAKSNGTAVITVKTTDGSALSTTCTVTVYRHTESISLNKSSLTLIKGNITTLTTTILPSTANKTVSWTSSDESVATVDQTGKVTAVGFGQASITATTEDGGKTASCEVTTREPINGYEFVDLGLPSGLLWATFNVGATKPEEYGDYFAWGEIETKSIYSFSTYKWCNGSTTTFTKYNTKSSRGIVDNKITLDPDDDAAHVYWGASWRMPTDAEWTELQNNCTLSWISNYNGTGIGGQMVTASNGNSIFLPAAGFRNDKRRYYRGEVGYYWSSSLYTNLPYDAIGYSFGSASGAYYVSNTNRADGQSVRPVSE